VLITLLVLFIQKIACRFRELEQIYVADVIKAIYLMGFYTANVYLSILKQIQVVCMLRQKTCAPNVVLGTRKAMKQFLIVLNTLLAQIIVCMHQQ